MPFITTIRFSLLMLLLGGILYPLFITGLGQCLFPNQANGSIIHNSTGQAVGSSLIAQTFNKPEYFHTRPSANNNDASNSGGSNLGPTSQKLITRIQQDALDFQKANPQRGSIPVDAVTASASGLDPHISLANAFAQVPRIAQARHIAPAKVERMLKTMMDKPFLAESPYVNVLQINLALDKQI